MSKLLFVAAYLKAILVASSFAFARGDMLPVIVISALFSLAQLNAKPIDQAELRDPVASSSSRDRGDPTFG
jgi:Na+/H+-dicarboxylate symporter